MKYQISKTSILVSILIVIAVALRFYSFGTVPPSPDWDEAALGYNAYAILHTGRDEYGAFLPVVMRSFDDYKPALYSYLIIPFLFIFGLSLQAVRMPSILFGIATVVVVFFLMEDLFNKKKLSFLIALLLAISPWHIQFSRIGFEANVGLSLNIFGIFFFLKGLRKPYLLFFSVASFCASLYVYQSEKVFSPLILLLLVVVFWKKLWGLSKKYLVFSCILGCLLVLPMGLYLLTNPNALARAKGVSVFADNTGLAQTSINLQIDHQKHDYIGLLFDNRRIVFTKEIIGNYLTHFDLKWLFITGDVSRHHAPFMGLLYLWELPFLLLGIYYFLFSTYSLQTKLLIFGWFLLAPIPASVTTGVPHAVRTINFLPTWQVFVGFGLMEIYAKISNFKFQISNLKIKYIIFMLCFMFFLLNVTYYLDQYFVQQNYYNSEDWQYGYAQAVPFIASLRAKEVIVSNQEPLDQSYMFFLFYLKYNPALYQQETRDVSGGFAQDHHFGKYTFRPIAWQNEKRDSTIVYVGRPQDFLTGVTLLKTIYYLDGQPAIAIVKGQ